MKARLLLSIIGLYCMLPVFAGDGNYSQINVRKINGTLESGTKGDGAEYDLAWDREQLVISLRVITVDYNNAFGLELGPQTHLGGVGGYRHVTEALDVYGRVEYGVYNLDSTSAKLAESNLYVLTAGARYRMSNAVELLAYVANYSYTANEISSLEVRDQVVLGLRGVLYLDPDSVFGLSVGLEEFDTYRHLSMGITVGF
ncbi:MAG: hypothetical protein OEZ39_16715 [Gammaproteobacteria bacterium]|nr:hypothetical protein [Gammaproteobacteria bacterium]MDH5653503.1 hypothetical protein [Gammaproteobacteria bacterium]